MGRSRKSKKIQTKKLNDNNDAVTQKPPYGLHNQGATCYLNSVLQVLSLTTEIHDRLEPSNQTDKELKYIFKDLKETTCETGNITKSLGIENVHQQRDAAECLELILNRISPQASEVFRGQLTYTTKCSSSHIINEETNPFWTLPLSLKNSHDEPYTVENGLKKFFQSKLFNGDNMVYCNDCNKKTEAESGCKMVVFPQILTLLLKRFEFNFNTMTHVKTNCIVGVPRALQRWRYELYGMVNHMGSLSGGHYTATVLSKEDNTWYEFDDTRVYKVDKKPFAEGGTYNSSAAYLLVYRASERLRDENEQRDTGRKMQKEKCDAKHKPVGPSSTEDTIQEDDVFVPQQTQNTKSCKQDLDPSAAVDLMEKGCKKEEDENSQQRYKRSTCKMMSLIVCGVIVGVVIALTIILTQKPYGLHNQGATCYLNSVLQVLSATTEIHDRLEPRKQIDQELINIFKKLKETRCETGNITESLGIENVHQQRDAAECLELILNKISPQASEVFRGQLINTTKCSRGHIINEETNPFWTFPLSLKDRHDEPFSVENGFANSTLLNGDMVHCNDCNEKTEAESGCEIVVFPQILTLLLKRFEFDFNTRTHVKTNCIVGVPRVLQRGKKRYELYGMVNHMGSLSGGHYTATVLSKEDNTWYEFDDTRVYKVDKQPFAEGGTYNSSAAYLLMYRASESLRDEDEQRDPGSKMQKEKCDANHKPVGPSSTEDTIQEDVFPQQTQNTKYSKQYLDRSETVDLVEKGCKKEEVTQKPPHGLHNQGATCYLNSVLQVLSATTEIHDRLEPKTQTDQELKYIFKDLKETRCETGNITKCLGIENVHQQRDAAECLELILNQISRPASEVFRGQLINTTKCFSDHIINKETNPFWTLPLSLKNSHDETFSVENGFAKFFQFKLLNGDMVHCNDCNEKTEAESGCEMVVFPQILTLLLKRFEFNFNTRTHVKTNCIVGVSHALQRQRYELYGMVNHMGSLSGGHYTATVLSKEDNTWYEFDDTHVYKVDKQPFAEGGTCNSSAAYLLVYRASESLRDENEQRDTGRKMQKEKCDAKHKPVGPSSTEDTIQEDDVFVPQQTQNTKSCKQDLDPSAAVDLMQKGCKKEEDENSQQLC